MTQAIKVSLLINICTIAVSVSDEVCIFGGNLEDCNEISYKQTERQKIYLGQNRNQMRESKNYY